MILLAVLPWIVLGAAEALLSKFASAILHGWWPLLILLVGAVLIFGYEYYFACVAKDTVEQPEGASAYSFDKNRFIVEKDVVSDIARATSSNSEDALKSLRAKVSQKLGAVTQQVHSSDVNGIKASLESLKPLVCPELTTEANERFKRLTYVLDRLQSRIGEEYSDVGSRTGWLLTGQAFLLAAFVTVLNAERLSPEAKHWLATGVGLTGAIISLVLTLSILYGHALIEILKRPRDDAEDVARLDFAVPKAGVSVGKPAHKFGHYATRYIPCLSYVVWVALTLLVVTENLQAVVPGAVGVLFPSDTTELAKSGRGWKELDPSPAFAIGADKFDAVVPGCPSPQKTNKAATDWLDDVVSRWKAREAASDSDIVILVGNADRIGLGAELKRLYDANVGLARSRAEGVKTMLMTATAREATTHKLTADRIMVLVKGPRSWPFPDRGPGKLNDCLDPKLQEDRRVEVWLPASP